MRFVAATLAGFGGLLAEMVALRRLGLLLGNTAEASTLVLAIFLLGLGVGGLTLPQCAWARSRPRLGAGILYGLIAGAVWLGGSWLSDQAPADIERGLLTAALVPGVAAVLMGASFPLLFAGTGKHAGPLLVGCNLTGSVAACFIGGNFLIPVLGFAQTEGIAALSYGAAALVLLLPAGVMRVVPPLQIGRVQTRGLGLALVSGVVVLGFEVLLLRRLPFFLDGFQPTLSGVLAACLLSLTLGAAVGTPLARFCFGGRAASGALTLGGLGIAVGLHEHLAPGLGRLQVSSDAGLHGRVALAAFVSAGWPCFWLGAIVPALLRDVADPNARAAVAGRLFCAQGVGSLIGALAIGHLLPRIWGMGFFVLAPLALALTAVVAGTWRWGRTGLISTALVVVVGTIGLTGAGPIWRPNPPVEGSRYDRAGFDYVAHQSDSTLTASVVYNRAQHSMVLFTDEFRAAYTGPGTSYMKVLGHLPFLLRDSLEDVAVIALGTGTTAAAVQQWQTPKRIHLVEISSAVLALVDHFAGDGPVYTHRQPAFLTDARTELHVTDGRRWLGRREPASLDLVTMEPLLPYAPGTAPLYSEEFYTAARRALRPDGLLVQWVPTHSMPREFFATLLATFARNFEHSSVWLVDQSTLLVGSERAHLPDSASLAQRFRRMPERARTTMHEAGITAERDLHAAFVGDRILPHLGRARSLVDDRPFLERIGYWSGEQRLLFYPQNLEVLAGICAADSAWGGAAASKLRLDRLAGLRARAVSRIPWLDELKSAVQLAAKARAGLPASVILHHEETLALRALFERRVTSLSFRDARRLAQSALVRNPGSALLQAVAGLDAEDQAVRTRAGENATAIDPTFYTTVQAMRRRDPESAYLLALAGTSPPGEHWSPLEDVSFLPAGDDLVAAATPADARGLAIRAVFPVRVARAYLALATRGPLAPLELAGLRDVLDPATFTAYAARVSERSGDCLREVIPIWRRDLPMPAELDGLRSGSTTTRVRLAEALAERRGAAACASLAHLLEDPALEVRQAAGVSLYKSFARRIAFDPAWDESRRSRAAREVRALHNPPP